MPETTTQVNEANQANENKIMDISVFQTLSVSDKLNVIFDLLTTRSAVDEHKGKVNLIRQVNRAHAYIKMCSKKMSADAAQAYCKMYINDICNIESIMDFDPVLTISQAMIVSGFVREIIDSY